MSDVVVVEARWQNSSSPRVAKRSKTFPLFAGDRSGDRPAKLTPAVVATSFPSADWISRVPTIPIASHPFILGAREVADAFPESIIEVDDDEWERTAFEERLDRTLEGHLGVDLIRQRRVRRRCDDVLLKTLFGELGEFAPVAVRRLMGSGAVISFDPASSVECALDAAEALRRLRL